MSAIVVGVDVSPSTPRALRWALEEARLRDATVRVVHAWDFPYGEGEIAPPGRRDHPYAACPVVIAREPHED